MIGARKGAAGEPRPFASLTSSLLARKGQAKPAMKPQGYTMMSGNLDDLGWNDMGLPAMRPVPVDMPEATFHPAIEPVPSPAIRQQAEIAEALAVPVAIPVPEQAEPDAPAEPVRTIVKTPKRRVAEATPVVALAAAVPTAMPVVPVSRAKPGAKAKAAFTLRLDPERHLRLRLACAVDHRSAQAIVTQALDAYLAAVPGIDALANAQTNG